MSFGTVVLSSLLLIGGVFFGAYKWSNRVREYKID